MLQRWLVVIIGLPLLLAALLLCPDWGTVIVVCGIAAAAGSSRFHCIVFVSARRKDDSFVCKRGSVFT